MNFAGIRWLGQFIFWKIPNLSGNPENHSRNCLKSLTPGVCDHIVAVNNFNML